MTIRIHSMKSVLLAVTAVVVLVTHASAGPRFSKEEISALPQDKVQAIIQYCQREWGDNFNMRIYCEDNQYQALKNLIDRGSITRR
jgi:hypothetical protein